MRGGYARPVPTFRHLLIFTLILLVLDRFTAVQVSVVGSLVLTIVISILMARFDRRRG